MNVSKRRKENRDEKVNKQTNKHVENCGLYKGPVPNVNKVAIFDIKSPRYHSYLDFGRPSSITDRHSVVRDATNTSI